MCWTTEGKISEHHLCGRLHPKRNDTRNLLYVCEALCHEEYHRGVLLLPGHMLWVKRELGEYDEAFLLTLRGWQSFPANWRPRKPPQLILDLRDRNRP